MTTTSAASPIVTAQSPVKTAAQATSGQPTAGRASKAGKANPVQNAASGTSAASGASVKSSVKISAAAVAALQEARETPAQTAAEARQGDRVAKQIVARQQAHAAQYKSNSR